MNKKKMTALILLMAVSWWGWRMIKKALLVNPNAEIDTLARTLWGEARGEGTRGMQAVANVITNRVKKGGWYGATYQEVCLKPYQFSCWLDTDPNYQKLLNVTTKDSQFAQAVQIAQKAYNGELPDITGGATNYHAKSVSPYWAKSMSKTTTIGNHVFYT